MKFKELEKDEELIKKISQIYYDKDSKWDDRMEALKNLIDKSERTVRKYLVKLGLKEKLIESSIPDQYKQAQLKIVDTTKKYYLISWAQNNTKAHKGLIENMEAYKNFIGEDSCEIIIIAGRYNNFNTLNGQKEEEYWDQSIAPYLSANKHDLNSNIQIRGDIKIVPTNITPLNGIEGLSNNESLIIGSPSPHLKSIPVVDSTKPKLLLTTCACTVENYSQSLSGKRGEFNHTLGFSIVEIKDDSTFFVRQVNAIKKTGEFTDLYYNVKNGVVKRTNEIEGIVFGDLHIGEHDEEVLDKTLNVLMKKLYPKTAVCHDIMSSYSINVHDVKNIYESYKKEVSGKNDLSAEIEMVLSWIGKLSNKTDNVVVVRSNHDHFVERWLNCDWRSFPTLKNSEKYMEFALLTLQGKAENGIIPYLINQRFPNYKCLDRNESYKIGGFEISQHNDVGPNGSRGGGVEQFKKLASKYIFGHSHSPARSLGAICVPTNTKLRLGYNDGLSSWLQGSVIISKETLKAQHILFINGEFTTFE